METKKRKGARFACLLLAAALLAVCIAGCSGPAVSSSPAGSAAPGSSLAGASLPASEDSVSVPAPQAASSEEAEMIAVTQPLVVLTEADVEALMAAGWYGYYSVDTWENPLSSEIPAAIPDTTPEYLDEGSRFSLGFSSDGSGYFGKHTFEGSSSSWDGNWESGEEEGLFVLDSPAINPQGIEGEGPPQRPTRLTFRLQYATAEKDILFVTLISFWQGEIEAEGHWGAGDFFTELQGKIFPLYPKERIV